jgi:L-fuculose-phosphate aldolase
MTEETLRQKVAEVAREMVLRGLAHGTSGNVSARTATGLFAVTPTGMDHASLEPEDIVLIDEGGKVVEGDRKPTSEVPMHLMIYRNRSDAGAVVHTHSDVATTFAVMGEGIPAVHYLLGFAGKTVRCAPYATYGTEDLAENCLEYLGENKAVLLGNHGVLAYGDSLLAALSVADAVETVAGYYFRARCVGAAKVLDDEEMERVMHAFSMYGQPKPARGEIVG